MEPRKGFVFYHAWWSAIVNLPREIQGDVLAAIIEYGLFGVIAEPLKPVAKAMLEMVKPQIDANNEKYINGKKGAEYGIRGGRPRKPRENPTETPAKPHENPMKTPKEDNQNPYKNKDKDIREDKSSSSACARKVEDEGGFILREKIEEYKRKPIWKASIEKKFGITADRIDAYLDDFFLDMCCRETNVLRVPSLFTGWLSQKITQNENDKNAADRHMHARNTLRSKLPAVPGHGLRDD